MRISRGSARVRVPSSQVSRTRHQRRLALRKDDHVTGEHFDLRFTNDAGETSTLRENVVRDEVLGAGQDAWGKLVRSHRFNAPWLRRLHGIEVGGVEANNTKEIRECVHE